MDAAAAELELKPCPCCGGRPVLEQDFHRGFDRRLLPYSLVRCLDCNLMIKRAGADGEVVTKLWNRRKAP